MDDELLALRNRMRSLQQILPQLHSTLAAALAQHPRRRTEMLAALRALASQAGFAQNCPDRACRRAGTCHAPSIGEEGPPCAAQWPDALLARLEDITFGILAAQATAERENAELAETILKLTASEAQATSSRPRRSRTRKSSGV